MVWNGAGEAIMTEILMVRIYLSESHAHLSKLLDLLHAEVRGVTVLRGISGFGKSGKLHNAHLVDLSFDLPLIVEFFDSPEKVQQVLKILPVAPDHVVQWTAHLND
ncbi:MAG: hypothetical protein RIS84_1352 [Pseudomonadota bacterium]|jgi:hypothetical protein